MSLCINCNYGSDCGFRVLSAVPVLFCTEHALMPESVTRIEAKGKGQRSQPAAEKQRPGDMDIPEMMGLCRNCEKRHSCTFEKPAGGIWHCEEYF